ncbi:MAG: glycosyltransferase family 2 protein [Candidatus Alcyoniella australis]|nr:glycosyltransferase family 2 protein [Candidatus Alcyoniella australis]
MKLSILMPVFNERNTISEIVKRVLDTPWEKELIIVDDGSDDGTREILQQIDGDERVRLILHDRNRGKGAAVRTAIAESTGDICLIQDADLEYDPRDYEQLIAPIIEKRADVVYGSRFLGPHRAFLFWHKLGNWMLTQITNILFNTILTDMETCYKAFRADLLRSLPLTEDGFEIEPELTAKVFKRGARVFEVPISYSGRDFDEGKKITWRHGFTALWALFKYRFRD